MAAARVTRTVGIIGTAGRKEDGPKMTKQLFTSMTACALQLIRLQYDLDTTDIALVSGGAAGADHVAVRLYLDSLDGLDRSPYTSLCLFLPCEWADDAKSPRYVDAGSKDWRMNPGAVANALHFAFSRRLGIDSLQDIRVANKLGAKLDTSQSGFHARNKLIADRAQLLIAFTFGDSTKVPKDGGTLDTWKKCKHATKIHVSLGQLQSGKWQAPEIAAMCK